MPKLTNDEYIARYRKLHRIWGEAQSLFTYLSFQEQRALHDYFVPSKELTDEELIAHRKKVTLEDPGLPQRAGKAFQVILHLDQYPPRHVLSEPDKRGRRIRIMPLARPEIDTEKMARALIDMIQHMSPEEQERLAKEGEKIQKKLGLDGDKRKKAA